jgi:aminodeoxychorismate lyase
MIVFLNGEFVPEDRALVSVFDRSFLYGDGLFETVRMANGLPFRWQQHMHRLSEGAKFLGISIPFQPKQLLAAATELAAANTMPEALLRLTLSRGVGVRGYSPRQADHPTLVMTLHPAPDMDAQQPPQWRLAVSSFRLPAGERLAQFKTCNKLPQILARAEADAAGAEEGLLLNTAGFAAEGASSNLFWIESQEVCTPPLLDGVLAGVTRAVVFGLCRNLGVPCCEKEITIDRVLGTEGVFLSLSSVGIAEAIALDDRALKQSPLTKQLHAAYLQAMRSETGQGSESRL